MPLDVVGVGFGRTGTLSLKAALERLGYGPCEHMVNLFEHPERFALWNEAVERKGRGAPIDWERIFAGYRATVDWPGAFFWRELVAAYPEAKVILTVRDPERWYDSAAGTIFRLSWLMSDSTVTAALVAVANRFSPGLRAGARMNRATIWEGTFDGRFADRAHAIRVFAEHNAAVAAAVPAERLLVYEVKQGWEPLCRFLEVPVPAGEPFPHLNDAAAFGQRVRARLAPIGVGLGLAGLGLIGVLGLARRRAARRCRNRPYIH